ncbi:MAG: hypothetical protein ABI920_10455 [Casimicrobiaceae bacterium]
MDPSNTKEISVEVCKVLDALAALSVDIACEDAVPGDQLVLPASRVRETCAAIHSAIAALKKILEISEAHGGGLIPASTQHRLDAAGE